MADDIKKELDEFCGLIEKVDRKNPDQADIQKVEALIKKYPEVYAVGMGMAGSVLKLFLDELNPKKSQQLFLEAEALKIKKDLGYLSSNQIEKLIIDQILFCWAGVNYIELKVFGSLTKGGYSWESGRYWQETLSRYQNRYLKAMETLARVRKLNINIQFNIATKGGQQVNVNEVSR